MQNVAVVSVDLSTCGERCIARWNRVDGSGNTSHAKHPIASRDGPGTSDAVPQTKVEFTQSRQTCVTGIGVNVVRWIPVDVSQLGLRPDTMLQTGIVRVQTTFSPTVKFQQEFRQ